MTRIQWPSKHWEESDTLCFSEGGINYSKVTQYAHKDIPLVLSQVQRKGESYWLAIDMKTYNQSRGETGQQALDGLRQ